MRSEAATPEEGQFDNFVKMFNVLLNRLGKNKCSADIDFGNSLYT